jgi:DNA replication and repair protein RecF
VHIRFLEVRDFRNYVHARVELTPGVVVLTGPNGQGKTNLLEAARYLSVYSSHRVSGDRPLVRAGCERALIRAEVLHGDRHLRLDCVIAREGANRVRLGGTPRRVGELIGAFATVLFAPEDLSLIHDGPAVRRNFLDGILIERRPGLAEVIRGYDRVLRQRNSLLRSARANHIPQSQLQSIASWDTQLAEFGAELEQERWLLTRALVVPLAEAYRGISGTDDQAIPRLRSVLIPDDLSEHPTIETIRERFLRALEEGLETDLQRGTTGVGPHRDELDLLLSGLVAREYASHGESWSLALALRLAAATVLRESSPAGDPVLMLDDVFAELDAARRERLAALISSYEQVLITAAIPEDLPEFHRPVQQVHILAGQVVDAAAGAPAAADGAAAGEPPEGSDPHHPVPPADVEAR